MKCNDTKANLTSCLLKIQQSDWLYQLYLLLVFAIYKLINIACEIKIKKSINQLDILKQTV